MIKVQKVVKDVDELRELEQFVERAGGFIVNVKTTKNGLLVNYRL
ncbi:MAG TPA: hypothetical protein VK061_00105 [Bacillota bacterium]|nr:hypothetical protein [Bacillota bacterium]